MTFKEVSSTLIPEIENYMKKSVIEKIPAEFAGLFDMMAYHLGWEGEGSGSLAQGKRIRPLILLLSTNMLGLDWRKALPAAISLELLHNFSLIHDDIEDKSELRRGRATLWSKWGIAQAINCGDAMFALSQLCMLDLNSTVNLKVGIAAAKLLNKTCLDLTGGQYLDIRFESQNNVSKRDYLTMVEGKTAKLIAAAAELGAVISESSVENQNHLRSFGNAIGIGFQCWDDWLGIWGNESQTGKSTSSDLLNRKKTLPILYALEKNEKFYKLSTSTVLNKNNITDFVHCLEDDGAKYYTEKLARQFTKEANDSLDAVTRINEEAYLALQELTKNLLVRDH
jgi:geranylgeranyl diphosphate synthase type I